MPVTRKSVRGHVKLSSCMLCPRDVRRVCKNEVNSCVACLTSEYGPSSAWISSSERLSCSNPALVCQPTAGRDPMQSDAWVHAIMASQALDYKIVYTSTLSPQGRFKKLNCMKR